MRRFAFIWMTRVRKPCPLNSIVANHIVGRENKMFPDDGITFISTSLSMSRNQDIFTFHWRKRLFIYT